MTGHDLTAELVGNICRCGRPKKPRQTLCRPCYVKLPKRMQQALYKRMGEGYEEAYAAAGAWLDGPSKDAK